MNAFAPASPQAASIAGTTTLFFVVCLIAFAVIVAWLLWAIVRRPRDDDGSPAMARRLAAVVGALVAVTVVTLVALAGRSVVSGRGLLAPSGPGAVTIDVIGHQWWWEFRYHDVTASDVVNAPNELHLPLGVPVVLKGQSRDVIHSFWVPSLHGKRDLVPGFVTHLLIQPDKAGVYRGQCAEFCGHQHAHMAFRVFVEPMETFRAWLESQRRAARPPASAAERRGHDVFMSGPCIMCHTIRGTAAGSRVGPDLTHVGSRTTIAAATLDNSPEHLARWITDSQSIKPGNRMPPVPLPADDRDALVAYLRSLQ